MTDTNNPFFTPSTLPYQLPPFDAINESHYLPAFERGVAEQLEEVEAIAADSAPATFDNTIVALEKTGDVLHRVLRVFYSVVSADTNPRLQEIQKEMAPKLAAHTDAIRLNDRLFARVKDLYDRREELDLDAEQQWLLRRYHLDFVRAGAELSNDDKDRLRAFNEEISTLSTQFSQNQLAATNEAAVVLDDVSELDGMSDDAVSAASKAAESRGLEGKYLLTFSNFSVHPQLANLTDPAVRERVYRASITRGSSGGDSDNSATLLRLVRVRAERARLLGYDNHAEYTIADQTAGTPQAALDMLRRLAPAAVANVRTEAAERAEVLGRDTIAPQDWSFATEKLRKVRYDFDAGELRPYLQLERVLHDGVFYAANQVFGLTFTERPELTSYLPEVRVFEVFDADGEALGLFCADYFTRDSKNGGAWMNSFVNQSHLTGDKPVVNNNLNIPKPPEGQEALLTFDEVTTMFHEFGHALHGLFSNVTYPRFSGTSVPRDFVEFPSQVNEMWATWPQILRNYAKHHETGEPMPQELINRLLQSQTFNEGFATTEYLASALLDLAWHQLSVDEVPDGDDPRAVVAEFEATVLREAGIAVDEVSPRYRSTYFGHVFGGGYAAGYYSYIWSEVLDADTVSWFKDNGGLSRANGDHFRDKLLSRGGSLDPMQQFRDFTGRDPRIEPLLRKRGLDAAI
ncbi:peptidyl-dipeptidase Dcp [Stackebrandtia endophytica]|uniref:Peptidyl-dipeptidase Dcp n=1 Tax=Stackebrandtia endophytica TaxID=1496996 RepID=A0A543ARQ1_9ACTN|nr:M3 family metallopeptidase [Stackebrandtia endophytica]TQL75216.1 peptidyl-dipeptidase Dcp [Stackebrandtia endophytica]